MTHDTKKPSLPFGASELLAHAIVLRDRSTQDLIESAMGGGYHEIEAVKSLVQEVRRVARQTQLTHTYETTVCNAITEVCSASGLTKPKDRATVAAVVFYSLFIGEETPAAIVQDAKNANASALACIDSIVESGAFRCAQRAIDHATSELTRVSLQVMAGAIVNDSDHARSEVSK